MNSKEPTHFVSYGGPLVISPEEPLKHHGQMWTGKINGLKYTLVYIQGPNPTDAECEAYVRHSLLLNGIRDGRTQPSGLVLGQQVKHTINHWTGEEKDRPPTGFAYEMLCKGEVVGYIFLTMQPNRRYQAIRRADAQHILPVPGSENLFDTVIAAVRFGLFDWYEKPVQQEETQVESAET